MYKNDWIDSLKMQDALQVVLMYIQKNMAL